MRFVFKANGETIHVAEIPVKRDPPRIGSLVVPPDIAVKTLAPGGRYVVFDVAYDGDDVTVYCAYQAKK